MKKEFKQDMMSIKDWKNFGEYPKAGSSIVLHVKGFRLTDKKVLHGFHDIEKFDAKTFDKVSYVPQVESTNWEYSWLYKTEVCKRLTKK